LNKTAHLAGIGFASIFGLSFMFSKTALDYVTPVGLIAYRFLIAFVGFELLRLTGVIKVQIRKSNVKALFLVALFQPVLYFLFETYGLKQTSSSEAGMMIAIIPIFVAILGSVFLKEKPTFIQVLFILLSIAGIILIQAAKAGEGLFGNGSGFILLLLAVVSAACFNIASRKASFSANPYEVTYVMMLCGATTFNGIYLIQLGIQNRIGDYLTNLSSTKLILPLLYLGLVASIGGFFLVNYTLGKLPAHVSSVYSNLATIIAIVAGSVFMKEQLEYYHFIGAGMILIGVYGTVWFARHRAVRKI